MQPGPTMKRRQERVNFKAKKRGNPVEAVPARVSEALRAATRALPWLALAADSVYLESVASPDAGAAR